MEHWTTKLEALSACDEAVEWCRDKADLETAWRDCKRGDWMLWLLGRIAGPRGSDSRRALVGAAAECARLALAAFEKRHPRERRVRNCLDICDRYAAGDETVTLEDLNAAADDAAVDDYAAADAAYAATHAAYAADAAAFTAAYAAAYAADADKTETLAKCADIVRRRYSQAPVLP